MERTHNLFVDNGLFVLSYYLNKPVNELTIEDIRGSSETIAELLSDITSCEPFGSLRYMTFPNSFLTQESCTIPNSKDNKHMLAKCGAVFEEKGKDLVTKDKKAMAMVAFDTILGNIGEDEVCMICGQRHVKVNPDKDYVSMLSKAIFPFSHGNTFMNYTNNLQLANICPVCVYLAISSFMNMRKYGNAVLLLGESNEFMETYTYDLQVTKNAYIALMQDKKQSKVKAGDKLSDLIEELIVNQEIYDGYVKGVIFNNSNQGIPTYEENFLAKQDLMLIKTLIEENLFSEFKRAGLMKALYKRNVKVAYLWYLKEALRSNEKKAKREETYFSQRLFDILDEEVWRMDKETLEIIKDVGRKVTRCTKIKSPTNEINLCKGLFEFEELINKWSVKYQEEFGENLLNSIDEFDQLCNRMKYKSIKNRLYHQLLLV